MEVQKVQGRGGSPEEDKERKGSGSRGRQQGHEGGVSIAGGDEKDVRLQLAAAQQEIMTLRSKLNNLLNPAGLYFESGVVVNLPIAMLTGWTEYFCQSYG